MGLSAPVWGQSEAVAVMKTGSYFGELAMLTGLPRGSFVMATNYCICSLGKADGLLELKKTFNHLPEDGAERNYC